MSRLQPTVQLLRSLIEHYCSRPLQQPANCHLEKRVTANCDDKSALSAACLARLRQPAVLTRHRFFKQCTTTSVAPPRFAYINAHRDCLHVDAPGPRA
jgi:hypothetical protein